MRANDPDAEIAVAVGLDPASEELQSKLQRLASQADGHQLPDWGVSYGGD